MLECELAQQEEMKVKYLSELGLLSVHYSCRYYVEWESGIGLRHQWVQTQVMRWSENLLMIIRYDTAAN